MNGIVILSSWSLKSNRERNAYRNKHYKRIIIYSTLSWRTTIILSCNAFLPSDGFWRSGSGKILSVLRRDDAIFPLYYLLYYRHCTRDIGTIVCTCCSVALTRAPNAEWSVNVRSHRRILSVIYTLHVHEPTSHGLRCSNRFRFTILHVLVRTLRTGIKMQSTKRNTTALLALTRCNTRLLRHVHTHILCI